jgi:hypothetical protein
LQSNGDGGESYGGATTSQPELPADCPAGTAQDATANATDNLPAALHRVGGPLRSRLHLLL